MSSLFTQVRRSKDNSNQRIINLQLWINKTLSICRLQESTLTSTGAGVQAINNRQPRKVGAWKGSRDHYKQFQSLKKCQSKRDCLIFEMLFSLLNIFYCFYNLKVSFITHAVILLHPYGNLLATGLHSARAEAKKITFFEFTWEVEESSFYVVTRGNNSNKS